MSSPYNPPDLSQKLLTENDGAALPQDSQQTPPMQSSAMMMSTDNMTSVMLASQPNFAAMSSQSPPFVQAQFSSPERTLSFHNDGASSAIHDGSLIVDAGEMMLQPGHGLRAEAQQSSHYRDWPFAVAFLVHVGIVTIIGFSWGMSSLSHEVEPDAAERDEAFGDDDNSKPAYHGSNDTDESIRLSGLLYLCLFSSLASVAISAIALNFMTKYAEQLIQFALASSCVLMGLIVMSMFSIGSGLQIVGVIWMIMLALTVYYAYSVWSRIPFAAANLTSALEAVQTNAGVCMIAYGVAFAGNLWVLVWSLAVVGVNYKETSCDPSSGTCESNMDPISGFFLLLSYFWTSQVFKNVLHVTVAGVIGTWWFAPHEASHMWSPAIGDSFRRATTYSFGSICMASLLVAAVRSLERIASQARRHGRGNQIIVCIVECILNLIGNIAEYFNKWALCYVGLYGYDYLTAGRKVMELFRERGWTSIINDNLASKVMVLVCIVISATTGLFGVLLNSITGWADPAFGSEPYIVVFLICTFIGLSLSIITMSVVLSAVDTVIVSFAEAPQEFEANHPRLSQQMKNAWQAVYPSECGF